GCSIKGTNVPPSTASYNYTPHQYPYYQTWYPQSQASYSSTPPLASNLLPSLHQAQASYAPSSSAGQVQVSYTTPAPQGYAQATYAYSTPSVQSSYGGSTSTQATPPCKAESLRPSSRVKCIHADLNSGLCGAKLFSTEMARP
ncbi:hypothetical protein FRC15_007493, partial [Serendipita sp. 397]